MTTTTHARPRPSANTLFIDLAVGAITLVMSFVAIAAADAQAAYAPALWTIAPIVFFAAAVALGRAHGDYARRGRALLLRDAAHWGVTLAALAMHQGFVAQGDLGGGGVGVVNGIVLALATVLAGVHAHLRMLPVGIAIMGACYTVTFLEDHLWATAALAVCALIASVAVGRRQLRKARGDRPSA